MTQSLEEASNLPPSMKRELDSLKLEIRKLWLGVNRRGFGKKYDQPFSLPGKIYVSESGRFYLPNSGGRLADAVVSLRVAGTTTTTVVIKKNGDTITNGTINLVAGANQFIKTGYDEAGGGDSDYWTVGCTAAGAAAEFLTVQLRFKMN